MNMKAFFTLHHDLPREGPGDRASLDWAMGHARPAANARIVDAGCGPGADIRGLLEHAPKGQVLAIDLHAPFIEQVRRVHGDDLRVSIQVGDMAEVSGPFDLIWSAGAVYHLGVRDALDGWRGALAPGGAVVFSELAWKSTTPSRAARDFWALAYPQMQDSDGVWAEIAQAGYRLVAERFLEDAAWEAYFAPLEDRIAALRASGRAADPDLAGAIAEQEAEIATWRAHRDEFGYLLCIVKPG